MTELEMIERARMYVQKLANGVNPTDGSEVPDGDVVYNAAAQHFVLDNLDAIIAEVKDAVALQGTPWTQEQDEMLAQMHAGGEPIKQTAAVLKRRPSAVVSRVKELGLN